MSIAIIFGMLGTMCVLALISYLLDKDEHIILRFILLGFCIVMIPIVGNSVFKLAEGTVLENMGATFLKYTLYLVRIAFTYLGLYIAYKLFELFGWLAYLSGKLKKIGVMFGINKKQPKWE